MEDLLKAQWREHLMERRIQLVEQSIKTSGREPYLDVPIQNQLLEGKLHRARLEVELYSDALTKAANFRATSCAIVPLRSFQPLTYS